PVWWWLLRVRVGGMWWRLARRPSLADDSGLAWRIRQDGGGQMLPNVSSHMLVSMHVFLAMLRYGVWLVALPLIGARGAIWDVKTVPLFRHPRGFPRLIVAALICGLFLVAVLWFGFSVNYAAT